MIARFSVYLPFRFSIPEGDNLSSFDLTVEGSQFRVYPPVRSRITPNLLDPLAKVSAAERINALSSVEQPPTDAVLLDGKRTMTADMLQIDVRRESFDRSRDVVESPKDTDPPASVLFRVANDVLARLRAVVGGVEIHPLTPDLSLWRIDYLTDDGGPVPQDPDKLRGTGTAHHLVRVNPITADIWRQVQALPSVRRADAWDALLLDALTIWPQIGPSIVSAAAAIETFISVVLTEVAGGTPISADLWRWLYERNDDFTLQPSINDKLSVLLKAVLGKSLREDRPDLWEAHQRIRSVRNNFVHRGRAVYGKNDTELGYQETRMLIKKADEIIGWVESLLPDALRRPRSQHKIQVMIAKQPPWGPEGVQGISAVVRNI